MAPVFLVFPQFLCCNFVLNHRCVHVCIFIYDEKCISACSDCEEIRFWSWGVGRIESTANRICNQRVWQRIEWVSHEKFYGHNIPLDKACRKRIEIHPFYFLVRTHAFSCVKEIPLILWNTSGVCEIPLQVMISYRYEPGIQSFQTHLYITACDLHPSYLCSAHGQPTYYRHWTILIALRSTIVK